RYLTLGYRTGSTAQLHIVGSRADRIVALNTIDCSIPTGPVGSTCELKFDIDAAGATPLVLWSKQGSIRLARKDRAHKCLLRVRLLDAPPAGDIPLLRSFRPCQGTFHELPEGSLIRADHKGKTYEWRLTYRGGVSQCDTVLCDPHVLTTPDTKVAYTITK